MSSSIKSSLSFRLRRLFSRCRARFYTASALISARLGRGDLCSLGRIFGTDKCTSHNYTPVYHAMFQRLRSERIKLLEIGIGGDEDAARGGHSLRMWKRYFPRGRIFGIDLYDKSAFKEPRIHIERVDQSSPAELEAFARTYGPFDIVIDDGSHICDHVVTSFKSLYPFVSENGFYVVEDTQTSYWPAYGGSSENLDASSSSLPFFKRLTDFVNHQEIICPSTEIIELGCQIVSLSFFHNLVFVRKGRNDEPGMDARNHAPPPQRRS